MRNLRQLFQSDKLRDSAPWKWERLPQALYTAPERCNILEADPVHVNVFHVIVAVKICNPTDRRAEIQIELQLTVTVSVVTIKGVAREEDLERIKPRKVVVFLTVQFPQDRQKYASAHRFGASRGKRDMNTDCRGHDPDC